MCGICGQAYMNSGRNVDGDILQLMSGAIKHRGPDDEGFYLKGPVGFGFRRLSIIDIADGHQPMSNEIGDVWLVFNGEIYNFRELRLELLSCGHRFRSHSDTEVIVHGYEQWGLDVLDHLDGMFAIALWDENKQLLMLARDGAGIKPLYYQINDENILFASELRAIKAATKCALSLDPVSIDLFLRYRYIPAPYTPFSGVNKLAPGSRLVVRDGKVSCERWWKFKPRPLLDGANVNDLQHELLRRYRDAVRQHLLSDVPLGLFLSGGIDSALLLALMNESSTGWNTFTVGYGEAFRDDELAMAANTARHFHAQHHELTIDRALFASTLLDIVAAIEEPVATASIVPMFHLCGFARRGVKTALIGQGPDELFGGYKRHLGIRYGEYWRRIPNPVRRALKSTLCGLPRCETLKRGSHSLDASTRLNRYQLAFAIEPTDRIDKLFHPGLLPQDSEDMLLDCWRDLLPLMENTDELGGFQFLEIRSSLPDELLMYTDKLSMAHGLELRVPFLAKSIIEFAECLPAHMKVRWFHQKWLHRRVAHRFLPREILHRKKRGFACNVVDEWLRNEAVDTLTSVFADDHSLLYDYLDFDQVNSLLTEHKRGQEDHHKLLFSILVLNMFLQTVA